jgi:uncharacterized protein (DUF2141 family)
MKIKIIFIVLTVLITNILYGQADENEFKLVIKNIRNDKGKIGVQILNEKDTVIKSFYIPVGSKNTSVIIKDISKGKYAIRIMHDENGNGDMDYNWIGIPKEGFGFSGSKKRYLGYPDVKDILVEIDDGTVITIEMIYVL